MKIWRVVVFIVALTPVWAVAQSHQPYVGLQSRTIKALSAEQIADLRAGRGMGFALPAELNGYPGPLHVIELADQPPWTLKGGLALDDAISLSRRCGQAVNEGLAPKE